MRKTGVYRDTGHSRRWDGAGRWDRAGTAGWGEEGQGRDGRMG